MRDKNKHRNDGDGNNRSDDSFQATQTYGIEIHVNVRVHRIEKKNSKYQIITSSGTTYEGDMVVHGAGRVPNITGLKLETSDIQYD
jgi:glutathione reductase (NADPH)